MKKISVLFLFSFLVLYVSAQTPPSYTSAELFLRLKKLNVLGSVLYVAAHPDDENSRLIAYLSNDRLYRTAYLSMTRGDGGQNLIGDEQGIELGLIRTQEMLAARRIDGAEQFFTRAFDFGFSKSTDEALQTWDKEKILSDVVWVIRKYQPDVIITRFPEDSRAGHGHHSASAVLAHEAFAAAADPGRFPEQFKYGVKPWQAKRLLWNTFNFGGLNTTSENQLKLDVGVYNAILGKSYGEIAAESRTQHKSQGAALTKVRGQLIEYFNPVAGAAPTDDIMDDVPATWNRVDGGTKIQPLIDRLIEQFSLSDPGKSVPGLVNLYNTMLQLKDSYWKTEKLKETKDLIEACSGIWMEATVGNGYAVQGDSLKINFAVINRSKELVKVNNIKMNGFDSLWQQPLELNKNYSFNKAILVSDKKPITNPYWLDEEMSPGSYNVNDQTKIGDAQSQPAFEVQFNLNIDGADIVFSKPVQYRFTDAVRGDTYQPLTILPRLTAHIDPELLLFIDGRTKSFEAGIRKHTAKNISPEIELTNTGGMDIKQESKTHGIIYDYSAKPEKAEQKVLVSELLFKQNGKSENAKELKTISFDHIPRIDYFLNTKIKFVVADVKISGRRMGYIDGAGDKVPSALQQMGYDIVMLKEKDIVAGNLQQFDAIITGVRAYDVHPWLNDKYDVLMDYINNGGNLIVQYNRQNTIGNTKVRFGPYPFEISNTRVTDENAEVKFLNPEHQVLNFPNKITPNDFEGWVQERGIYFAGQTDARYQTVLSMHDAGETEHNTSLIIADYGKGKFVYTGLVFFRELPAGVPGAYRLLANIIALNRKKGF
ncbi:MAG TPA: PIG-L family deacetylase [Puia sp.]|nr:PIG-L family deacetylase [Puia sp.]